ncbi:hypothetical protein R3P38DRAFT_3272612 [Favolaschia claudopus]|uniref:Fungal-type protein kinase domain-containing protein n=1 Tax=Favolaschia claudopus TaxID=2862362 RepID=A0AAW0B273_9AGAR
MPRSVSGVPQAPIEFFLDNILPPFAEWHALVEDLLVDQGHIVGGQWHSESTCSSVAEPEPERDLISIIENVLRAGRQLSPRPATCCFMAAPPLADRRDNSQQSLPPDAQFELVDTSSPYSIAIPWRFHSMRTASEFNEEELIWSCQDALSIDPSRRFSYGISVREESVRIWFFSRAHELVSSPINEKPASNLVQLLLRLAFATTEQLGYDTTMSHLKDAAGSTRLKLTVGRSTYITKRLLSDRPQDGSCGRATRVWEAYREDDPHCTSVAVKDCWMSADAVQEGTQLKELHEKLQAISHPSLSRPPAHYFLSVVEHGFVPTSGGVDDDTLLMTRGSTPRGVSPLRLKHYRIVFNEVGTTLYNIPSLSDVMRALADATRALQLLYQLGLVHRDVSAGNIIVVDGVGKLTDLEFMRPYRGSTPSSSADRYVGTSNFIPGEVAAGIYSYASAIYRPVDGPSCSEDPPFRYNPFHDLESTLWIGIWIVFYRLRDIPAVEKFFDAHFPDAATDITAGRRAGAIRGFLSLKQSHPFHPVLEALHDARFSLLLEYARFESDFANQFRFLEDVAEPFSSSPFRDIHPVFIEHYEKAASRSEGLLLTVPAEDNSKSKRKATQDLSPHLAPVEGVDVARAASPERPAKKFKSESPRRPPPTRSSASSGKRRSSNARPTRHSTRLAEKKRSPMRNRATR